jgi:Concanavalin A-like lectin/glucanases superfamily
MHGRSSSRSLAARCAGMSIVAVLLAGSVLVRPVAAATPQQAAPAQALGEAAARAAAMASGRRVEATALTRENQQVFANPDGTFTMVQSVEPVRVRRGSGWVPVDTTLRAGPDGTLNPVATTMDMALSGGGIGPLVRMRRDGKELALRWPGRLPAPMVAGDTATYRDVLPGVDLMVRVASEGFSQLLVVKSVQAAANPALARLRLVTSSTGVRIRAAADGGLEAMDSGGAGVFHAPAPYMWDSSGAGGVAVPGGRVRAVRVQVGADEVSLLPERSLLLGADTRYPVYIDPAWTGSRTAWTQVWSNYPSTSFYNGANLGTSENVARVGYDATDNKKTRSFFRLDTSGINDKHIIKATLQTYEEWSRSCTTRQVEVWETGGISSSTTWNNQPSWITRLDYKSVAKGFSSSCPAGGVEFTVTAHVAKAAANNWDSITEGMKASSTAESNLDTVSWKKFHNNPTFTIDYNTVPTTPTNLTTNLSTTCTTGTGRLILGTATPTLRATVSDADNAVMAHFQWSRVSSPAGLVGEWTSASVAGKTPTTVAKTIPSGAFSNGEIAKWRVRAEDGVDVSAWSTWCEFTVDTTRPPIPTVTSAAFPDDGAQNAVMGTSITVDFGPNGSSDVKFYEYAVNGDANVLDKTATPSASGVPATAPVVPDRFVNWLHVRSVDGAGNRSDVATVVFYATSPSGPAADWALDETGNGAVAADSSPNGFDATLHGGASWSDGQDGGALHLDGTTGYASTAGPVVDTMKSFSISAWVRLTDKSVNRVVAAQVGANTGAMALYYSTAYDRWVFNRTTSDVASPTYIRAISTTVPMIDGRWVHLAGVYDAEAQQVRLYVNGVLEATTAFTAPWSATGAMYIGRALSASQYWAGDLDEVRVYDRILLPGELQQVPRLAGQWKLDETSGTTAVDALGAHPATWSATGVTRTAGISGNAVEVNGSTGVLTASGAAIRTDGSYTVSAWVRPSSLIQNGIAVSQDGAAVAGFNLGYSWNTDMGAYLWSVRSSAEDKSAAALIEAVDLFDTPTAGVWTYLVSVYDAASHSLRLYVDGQFVAETHHASNWNAGGSLRMGRGQASNVTFAQYLPGGIDDVRAYAGALSDEEILDSYHEVVG